MLKLLNQLNGFDSRGDVMHEGTNAAAVGHIQCACGCTEVHDMNKKCKLQLTCTGVQKKID